MADLQPHRRAAINSACRRACESFQKFLHSFITASGANMTVEKKETAFFKLMKLIVAILGSYAWADG